MTTSFHNIIKYIVGENNIGAPNIKNYFGAIKFPIFQILNFSLLLPIKNSSSDFKITIVFALNTYATFFVLFFIV